MDSRWTPWELGGFHIPGAIFLGNEQVGFLAIPSPSQGFLGILESLQHLFKKKKKILLPTRFELRTSQEHKQHSSQLSQMTIS